MHRGKAYDPWLHAEQLGIEVRYSRRLPVKGVCRMRDRLIVLRAGHSYQSERSTLAHEIQHVALGHVRAAHGPANTVLERRADLAALAWLIDPDEYAAAEALYTPHAGDLADRLDVSLRLVELWQRRAPTAVLL